MGCVLFKVCTCTVWEFGWPHVQGIHSSPSHYSIVCRIISSKDLVTELCCPSKVVHVLYGGYVLMSPGCPQHPRISVPLHNGTTVVWAIAWQFSQLRQWSQKESSMHFWVWQYNQVEISNSLGQCKYGYKAGDVVIWQQKTGSLHASAVVLKVIVAGSVHSISVSQHKC